MISIRKVETADIVDVIDIWNDIISNGNAFCRDSLFSEEEGINFFKSQSFSGVAVDDTGSIVGAYVLHPNYIGHCSHICNTTYAVKREHRGKHIGELLVRHSMEKGKELGFLILQFNTVVASNDSAIRLYKKLGFTQLGIIPRGYRWNDGTYEDIIPHYHVL